jgi:phage shock protein PspC (stress-responsive transcriptional regulator)
MTRVEVKTEFFPLAFMLSLITPVIEINGEKHNKSWGTHSFDLEPGEYNFKIYFPYFGTQCGANEIRLTIKEGEMRKISYYAPVIVFMEGTIKEEKPTSSESSPMEGTIKEEKPTSSESSPKVYEGFYCSSDDKVLFGFCGGLAHKFKVDTTVVRIAVFLAAWFCIGWIYFVGLFLPKLPTKNI